MVLVVTMDLWRLDVKLDTFTIKVYRMKIRSTIQQAFNETLSSCDYRSFSERFTKKGNNSRGWMIITGDTEPFPGVPPHYWGLRRQADRLLHKLSRRLFWNRRRSCFGRRRPGSGFCGSNGSGRCCDACPRLPFPAVDPAAPFRGVGLAVAPAYSKVWTASGLSLKGAGRCRRVSCDARFRLSDPSTPSRDVAAAGAGMVAGATPAGSSAVRYPPRPLRRRARPAALQAPPTRRPRRRSARPIRPTPRRGRSWISAPGPPPAAASAGCCLMHKVY